MVLVVVVVVVVVGVVAVAVAVAVAVVVVVVAGVVAGVVVGSCCWCCCCCCCTIACGCQQVNLRRLGVGACFQTKKIYELDMLLKNTVDRRNPANQMRLVVYPVIYKVLYMAGGAGFLPSAVPYPK